MSLEAHLLEHGSPTGPVSQDMIDRAKELGGEKWLGWLWKARWEKYGNDPAQYWPKGYAYTGWPWPEK